MRIHNIIVGERSNININLWDLRVMFFFKCTTIFLGKKINKKFNISEQRNIEPDILTLSATTTAILTILIPIVEMNVARLSVVIAARNGGSRENTHSVGIFSQNRVA